MGGRISFMTALDSSLIVFPMAAFFPLRQNGEKCPESRRRQIRAPALNSGRQALGNAIALSCALLVEAK